MRKFVSLFLIVLISASCGSLPDPDLHEADVIVYGGTSAGVIAAIQVSRMGNSVILVGPDKHLGGLTSSGLGWTDSGNTGAVGGVAREFYHRIWQKYQNEDTWKWESKEDYGT